MMFLIRDTRIELIMNGVSINEIDHNSTFSQNQIDVDRVYKKALSFLNSDTRL